jgi:protein TonB
MTMRLHLFILPIAAVTLLGACGKSATPAAPAIAPTELTAAHTPPPEYPVELACAGVGGKTILKVTIGTGGSVTDVQLLQSSGQKVLDESAQKRVREEWKFNPATRNGQPVAQTIQVPVDFNPPQPKPDECFVIEEHARRS